MNVWKRLRIRWAIRRVEQAQRAYNVTYSQASSDYADRQRYKLDRILGSA